MNQKFPPAPDDRPQDDAQRSARTAQALREAQSALQAGDFPRAFAIAEGALRSGLRDMLFYKLRAVGNEQRGQLPAAIADFQTVLAAEPANHTILTALGLCLAKVGRPSEAIEVLNASLAIAPAYAATHYNRGWTLESVGDLVGARRDYARATELDPGNAQALGNLAMIHARSSDWEAARSVANRALRLDAREPTANIVLAQADFAQGQLDAAEQRLRRLLADTARVVPHERSVVLSTLGDVLDRKGSANEAFGAYEQANEGLRTLYAPRFLAPGVETSLPATQRLIRAFAGASGGAWMKPAPTASARGHVFLVGFPRSGTTLLGQVLAGHSDIVTLDEKDTLTDSVTAFMTSQAGLDALAAAGENELEPYRAAYWTHVAALGADDTNRVLIDKSPMASLALPLIRKLFPQAKVLFARRDPRDVVISCFRRQFGLNLSTWELLTLPGAARFYDAVMQLMAVYGEKLDLDLRFQRYEDLVSDFEGETRALCDFIGVEWRASLAEFGERSRSRAIATPSAPQVARGLYADGSGQWKRYREQLAPVLPVLEPWVDRFGYAPSGE